MAVEDQPEFAVFVQLNDLYHIDTSADPAQSASRVLPRVATLLRRLREQFEDHRVWFCLPGDFLNPSCLSRVHQSQQIIDILNRLGLRLATFGNHEFDFDKDHFTVDDLIKRIANSDFTWLASNLDAASSLGRDAFVERSEHLRDVYSIQISPQHDIHVLGLLYESEYKDFGKFRDPVERSQGLIRHIKDSYIDRDGVYRPARTTFVALTHQNLGDDEALAKKVPELHLIMGGHDHEVLEKVIETNCLIVKSKSNARTLRVNAVTWIPKDLVQQFATRFGSIDAACNQYLTPQTITRILNVALTGATVAPSALDKSDPDIVDYCQLTYGNNAADLPGSVVHKYLGDGVVLIVSFVLDTFHPGFQKLVEPDQEIEKAIQYWLNGSPEHRATLLYAPEKLETSDDACRSRSTNFGNFVADVISGRARKSNPGRARADIGLVNGGSFRLNRDIAKGEPITKGIICDLLFHPNDIRVYRLPGSAIEAALKRSHEKLRGQGNFLQLSGLNGSTTAGDLRIEIEAHSGSVPLVTTQTYTVAATSYLTTSKEAYGDIFEPFGPPEVVANSIREAVERELLAQGNAAEFSDAARWH
jgi:2',3'-cyclic-nucleotide 2'-phosphodiesterase (5'-nucleotidase family)